MANFPKNGLAIFYFQYLVKTVNAEAEKLKQARDEFVAQWGALGTQWGINRTMAQIHALLIEREAEYVADIKRRIAHVSGEDAPLFAGATA